jgi:hypothetical protein
VVALDRLRAGAGGTEVKPAEGAVVERTVVDAAIHEEHAPRLSLFEKPHALDARAGDPGEGTDDLSDDASALQRIIDRVEGESPTTAPVPPFPRESSVISLVPGGIAVVSRADASSAVGPASRASSAPPATEPHGGGVRSTISLRVPSGTAPSSVRE